MDMYCFGDAGTSPGLDSLRSRCVKIAMVAEALDPDHCNRLSPSGAPVLCDPTLRSDIGGRAGLQCLVHKNQPAFSPPAFTTLYCSHHPPSLPLLRYRIGHGPLITSALHAARGQGQRIRPLHIRLACHLPVCPPITPMSVSMSPSRTYAKSDTATRPLAPVGRSSGTATKAEVSGRRRGDLPRGQL
ncbi:hypothetical protein PSPO01_07282 [Paraphaeosphaeria sporulosa]